MARVFGVLGIVLGLTVVTPIFVLAFAGAALWYGALLLAVLFGLVIYGIVALTGGWKPLE